MTQQPEIKERLAHEPEDPREPTAETEEPDKEVNQTDGDEAGEDDESEDNDEIDGTEEPSQRTSTRERKETVKMNVDTFSGKSYAQTSSQPKPILKTKSTLKRVPKNKKKKK